MNSGKFKMAAYGNHFMSKSQCLYLLTLYIKKLNVIVMRTGMVIKCSFVSSMWSSMLCSYRPEIGLRIDIISWKFSRANISSSNWHICKTTVVVSTSIFLGQRIDCNHFKHTGTILWVKFEMIIRWLPTDVFQITMSIWNSYIFSFAI